MLVKKHTKNSVYSAAGIKRLSSFEFWKKTFKLEIDLSSGLTPK